ncbi:MAG TPA: hypothetical protein GX711_04760 [Clostridia bacterium]|nr:hypothetical protein [Clostridia bacterium]
MAGIEWGFFVNLAYLCVFLLIGTFLRARLRILQRCLIPVPIIAGFLGIIFGQYVFKVINPDEMASLVYHFLTLSFIAMGLRGSRVRHSYGTVTTLFIHHFGHNTQGLIGLFFTLVLLLTYLPGIFPTFGIMLNLGFANSPGVAYSIGTAWEEMGFVGGGQVGLSMGAIGFLVAYIIGIILVNWGIRKNKTYYFKGMDEIPQSVFRGIIKKDEPKVEAGKQNMAPEAMDSLTLHVAVIGTIFLMTYFFLINLTGWIASFGDMGKDLANVIGGFGFLFGVLIAFVVRRILLTTNLDYIVDDGLLSRLGGTFVDLMIMTGITGISFVVIKAYLLEIVLLSAVGTIGVLLTTYYFVDKMQIDYKFERFISLFGMLTGTVASGLALLRIVDPQYDTPVAEDLVYAGGMNLILSLPLLLLINIPAFGYVRGESIKSILLVVGLQATYFLVMFIIWKIYAVSYFKKKDKSKVLEQ